MTAIVDSPAAAPKRSLRRFTRIGVPGLQVIGLLSLPGVCTAWLILVIDQIPWVGLYAKLGPYQTVAALLSLTPALVVWGRASHASSAWIDGQVLRRAAVLGVAIGLCLTRIDALTSMLQFNRLLALMSLLCFLPASIEWYWLRPWRTEAFPFTRTGASLRPAIYDAVITVGLPILFFVTAPLQRYPPPGWVDAGIYLGQSLDYLNSIRHFGWNYYALRVGYLFPSYVLHDLLPPSQARLLLNVGFYLCGNIALYAGARIIWGRSAATLSVAFLAYNPAYLSAVNSGYVVGAACAYLFLLFATLALWRRSRNDGWLVAAGSCAAFAALTHPLAIPPAGLIGLFFCLLEWNYLRKRPLIASAMLAFGATITWLFFLYALSDVNFGARAFLTLSWIVSASVNGIGERYAVDIHSWLPQTTRLFPPLLALAAMLLALKSLGDGLRRLTLAAMALTLTTGALFPLYDLLTKGVTTQAWFYSGLTLPGASIGIAGAAAALSPRSALHRKIAALIATAVAFSCSWNAPLIWGTVAHTQISLSLLTFCLAAAALAPVILAASTVLRPLLGLVLVAITAMISLAIVVNPDTRSSYRAPGGVDHAELFRASIFVDELIRAARVEHRNPVFWFERGAFATRVGNVEGISYAWRYRGQQATSTVFDSIAAMWLWDRSLVSATLKPGAPLAEEGLALLSSTVTVVVLAQDPLAESDARATLGRYGFTCALRRNARYESKSFSLLITLIDITGRVTPREAPCNAPA